MITIKIKMQDGWLDDEVKAFEKQRVTVGILDKSKMAAKAKPKSAGFKSLKGATKARKIKGRDKDFPLWQLADFLDSRYGFITQAALNPENAQLNLVMQEMSKIFDGKVNPRRIENAAIALIRNPILRLDLGNNSTKTIKEKGFNMPLVRTGAMFSEIKARYEA